MKAGRELDAKIAEKVMGWKIYTPTNGYGDAFTLEYYSQPGEDIKIALAEVQKWAIGKLRAVSKWNPSTNIAHAWEVVEKLKEDHPRWYFELHWRHDAKYRFQITEMHVGYNNTLIDWGETAPLAICLAALKAVEGK